MFRSEGEARNSWGRDGGRKKSLRLNVVLIIEEEYVHGSKEEKRDG